jgi:heterodisulfide reductase subunit A-like polyferredoxin
VTGEKIHQTVDMVVLATGMQPTAANAKLPADLTYNKLTGSSSMTLPKAACLHPAVPTNRQTWCRPIRMQPVWL